MPAPTFASRAPEYRALWEGMTINKARAVTVLATARKIAMHKADYEAVSRETTVPWFVIGIIHAMECGLKFDQHLHNGDPLTARTERGPKGRPKTGSPPFSWVESAIDALRYDELDKVTDWSVGSLCWTLERYNGPGYMKRGTPSPYLWSFTNQYERGKFIEILQGKKWVSVYNPTLVSEQAGAMALLRALVENGDVILDKPETPASSHPWPVAIETKPSLPAVALKSTSFWLQAQAFLAVLVGMATDWADRAVTWVSGLIGIIPASKDEIAGIADSGSQVAGYLKLNAGKVVVPLVMVTLVIAAYRHIRDKREMS